MWTCDTSTPASRSTAAICSVVPTGDVCEIVMTPLATVPVFQLVPSVEYCHELIVPAGAVTFTVSEVVLAPTMLEMVGAASTVVPEKFAVAVPLPAEVTARICSCVYAVFAVRPVSVIGVAEPVALAQVEPPSVENSYPVMVPTPVGAVNATDNLVGSPATPDAEAPVGAADRVRPDVALLATPDPPPLTARILTEYEVFATSVRPVSDLRVIVSGELVPVVLRALHVVPPSVEYS